jgi:rhodanese-related sulfurtransferase
MHRKSVYFTRHRGWLAILIVFLFGLAATPIRSETDADQSVSPARFKQLLDQQPGGRDVVLLDIRTVREFNAGHIEGAVLLDYYASDFVERLKTLPRDKTYLVYCRSGNRSAKSLSIFNMLEFEHVLHLETGIRGWVQERYPVVRLSPAQASQRSTGSGK